MNNNDVYVNCYNESINSHFSTIEYTKLVNNDLKIEQTKKSNNKVKLCIVIFIFMIIITYIIAIIVTKY